MKKIVLLFVSFFAFGAANAQVGSNDAVDITIPTVALIQLSATASPVLNYSTVTAPVAGGIFPDVTFDLSYLQYTSILASGAAVKKKSIYVSSVASGTTLTEGISLTVEVMSMPTANPPTNSSYSATSSNGFFGTQVATSVAPVYIKRPSAATVVSGGFVAASTPVLIKDITSCFTGTANTQGPRLKYTASMRGLTAMTADNFEKIRAGTYTFTVTYTLADNV